MPLCPPLRRRRLRRGSYFISQIPPIVWPYKTENFLLFIVRRHAAQSETAKLAGERRTATARASSLELEVCEANKCVKTLERSLAESNSTNDDLRLKLQDATGLRKDVERRFEETREGAGLSHVHTPPP